MKLKPWLDAEKGRAAALAKHVGVSKSMVSQMANGGAPVPPRLYRSIRDFTAGAVTLEDLLPDDPNAPAQPSHPDTLQPVTAVTGSIPAEQGQPGDRRQGERRKVCIPVPPELDLRGTKQDPRAAGGAA